MHKLFLSKNSEYVKFMSMISQQKLKNEDVDVYIFHDFSAQYKEIEDVALTISLFEREKCIIIENCQFLTANHTLTEEAKQVFDKLIMHKPVQLLLTVFQDKLDERKKIAKQVRKEIEVVLLKDDNQTATQLLKHYLKQEKITMPQQMIQSLLLQSNQNLFHSISEIQRFVLKYNTKDFTHTQISEVQKIPDEDIFFLSEYLNKNNYRSLFLEINTWSKLHPNNSDFQRLMRYLFNHAKLLYEVANLIKKGYTYQEIGKLLNVHEYRVKLLLPHVKQLNITSLELFINSVIEGDYMMKRGVINRILYMEYMFKSIGA